MSVLVKTVSLVILVMFVQLVHIQVASSFTVDTKGFTHISAYDPPDDGGPDAKQGAGTR